MLTDTVDKVRDLIRKLDIANLITCHDPRTVNRRSWPVS